MTRLSACAGLCAALCLVAGNWHLAALQAGRAGGMAWAIVNWRTGTVEQAEDLARLREPASPGSIVKLATLAAAFAAGLADANTRVPCAGEAEVKGELVRCSHPRLRHPLRPAEALAVSCNVWFATIGARLPRGRLDGVLTAVGLPPTPRSAPMPLAAAGLNASKSTPLAWIEALARLLREPSAVPLSSEARATIVEGLRGAALYGTASGFSERGLDAIAKTGTSTAPAGGTLGVVVAGWPASAPARGIVLVAAGVAGKDAADLAAQVVANAPAAPRTSVVGAPSAPRATAAIAPPAPPAGEARRPPGAAVRVGTPLRGGGYSVEAVPLEDYVARVLAGEAAAGSQPAALEALAIAIRTFAAANLNRHGRDGFDLCTLTHCQVVREPYAAARAAAAATAGQVLLADRVPATIFYTASCGGRTERPSAVWPGADDPPYLPSKRDRACGGEPRWASEIPVQDLQRTLIAAGYRGAELRDVRVADHTSSGRVATVRLKGMTPDVISGQDLRMIVGRTLGWQLLKSTDFTVRRTGGGYRFDGGGFGHGVGLCVLGSVRRAEHGDSAKKILREYFPGLEIGQTAWPALETTMRSPPPAIGASAPAAPAVAAPSAAREARTAEAPVRSTTPGPRPVTPPPAVSIVLASSAEPERAALTAFVQRAIADLSRATGRSAPPGLNLVFHPSAESFRRETGESWWMAARTRDARIDLLPLEVLRDRGTVETTVRHELAHALTGPALEGRAEWVKEGVAMHFAGEPPPASLLDGNDVPRRVRCPSDDDLRRPMSASTARQAYGLAAACVARAIALGTRWTDIR